MFGGHRHCDSGDTIFPFFSRKIPHTRLLPPLLFPLKHMACDALIHEISERRCSNLPVCPRRLSGTGHISITTDNGRHAKKFVSLCKYNEGIKNE